MKEWSKRKGSEGEGIFHGRRSNRRLCEWLSEAERVYPKRRPTSTHQHRFLSPTRHSQSHSVLSRFNFSIVLLIFGHSLWVTNLNPFAIGVVLPLQFEFHNLCVIMVCIKAQLSIVVSMLRSHIVGWSI